MFCKLCRWSFGILGFCIGFDHRVKIENILGVKYLITLMNYISNLQDPQFDHAHLTMARKLGPPVNPPAISLTG